MKKTFKFGTRHVVLLFLSVVWLVPIIWLVATSFSGYKGINTAHFFPETWSLNNYKSLFLEPDSVVQYVAWFKNTLIIAIFRSFYELRAFTYALQRKKTVNEFWNYPKYVPWGIINDCDLLHFEIPWTYQQPCGYDYCLLSRLRFGIFNSKRFYGYNLCFLKRSSKIRRGFRSKNFLENHPATVKTNYCIYGNQFLPCTLGRFCIRKTDFKFRYFSRLDNRHRTLQHVK